MCASHDFLNTLKEPKQRSKWWNFGISSTKINFSDRHLSPDCLTFFRVLGEVCCACRSIFSHPFLLSSPRLCCPVLSQALKHCIRAPPTGRWNFTSTGASAVPGDPQTATFHYDFRRTALKTLIQNKCVYATIIYEGPFIPAAVLIGTCRAITCIPNDIN